MLYYSEDREGIPIYIIHDYWKYNTTTTELPDNGDDIEAFKTTTLPAEVPAVRECPLCKGTGLIKVGKDPVGHVDT